MIAVVKTVLLCTVRIGLSGSLSGGGDGLFYHDLNSKSGAVHRDMHSGSEKYACVSTVAESMDRYTKRQVNGAKAARDAYCMLGFPSYRDFETLVRTKSDIKIARDIFGPDIASLKGKTVRHTPERVVTAYVAVPAEIYDRNKDVVVVGDVMFVSGFPFLVTVSGNLNLITSKFLADITGFNCIRDFLGSTHLNLTATAEHAPEIERKIHVIKEQHHALLSTLLFSALPGCILIESIVFIVMRLNAFPTKTGCSTVYSPRAILTKTSLDWKHHCRVPFGSYCQVYTDTRPHNSSTEQTVNAICMGPTGKFQGSYKFYALDTCQKIVRHQFTHLPMPKSVIQRVNRITEIDHQSHISDLKYSAGSGEIVETVDTSFDDSPDILPTKVPHMAGVDNNHFTDHFIEEDVKTPVINDFDDPIPVPEPFYDAPNADHRSVVDDTDIDHRSDHEGVQSGSEESRAEESFFDFSTDESMIISCGEESFNIEIPSDDKFRLSVAPAD
eukprot:CCRYP_019831-RA/>CCRYP_019831-RA protein AED:0.41 eAED:0.28 QI:0/0/0/1/1/1/2/0/498